MKPIEDREYCELDKRLAVLVERIEGRDHALSLQKEMDRAAFIEYERRLAELKGATDKLEEKSAEQTLDNRKWRDSIDRWRWITIGAGMLGGVVVKILWH